MPAAVHRPICARSRRLPGPEHSCAAWRDSDVSESAPQGNAARRVAFQNRLTQGDEKAFRQSNPPAKLIGRQVHAFEPSFQCLWIEVENEVEILGDEVTMK